MTRRLDTTHAYVEMLRLFGAAYTFYQTLSIRTPYALFSDNTFIARGKGSLHPPQGTFVKELTFLEINNRSYSPIPSPSPRRPPSEPDIVWTKANQNDVGWVLFLDASRLAVKDSVVPSRNNAIVVGVLRAKV